MWWAFAVCALVVLAAFVYTDVWLLFRKLESRTSKTAPKSQANRGDTEKSETA
jgi:hypothetical protein